MSEKKECPRCKGEGEYSMPEATGCRPWDDGWYPCDRCEGTGEVEADD